MNEALGSELIHVSCGNCHQISSFSLHSLERDNHPKCPFCGATLDVDLKAAENDALREAEQLDQSFDSLGSLE